MCNMASDNSVYLVYSVDDGVQWSKYLVNLLSKVELDVRCVELGRSGSLPASVLKFRQSRVIVLLASPGFLKSLQNDKSESLDEFVSQKPATADQPSQVVLFLCGPLMKDLEEVDSKGRRLSDRFPGLESWTIVQHDDLNHLPRAVCDLVTELKTSKKAKPVIAPAKQSTSSTSTTSTTSTKKAPKLRPKTTFKLFPDEVRCEEPTMVVLSFDDNMADSESELKMHVEITGEQEPDGDPETPIKAVVFWLNSHTGYFMSPIHQAGFATVKVFNRGHSIGSKTITYNATSSEVTTGIIQILLHQLGVLCDLLLVKRHLPSVDELDALLSDVFQNDTVTTLSFEKFLESYRFLRDTEENSQLELPTPLHLAAKYGLSELTSRLLDLPDAIHSSTVANCDGHSPEDLARIGQRRSLAAVLENFREVGDGLNKLYVAYVNSSEKREQGANRSLYLDMSGHNKRKMSKSEQANGSSSDYEEVEEEQQPQWKTRTLPANLRSNAGQMAQISKSAAAASNTATTARAPVTSTSQQELIDILEQVKNRQLSMAEAEILFREWKMRYSGGMSPSFKQKQEQLSQMRSEVQQVKESSTIGSFISNLFGSKSTAKQKGKSAANAAAMDDVDSTVKPSDALQSAVSAGVVAATATGGKPLLSAAAEPDNRCSSSSLGSRSSTASRASNVSSSGIDIDPPMFQNLQRVEEELQSAGVLVAPPVPRRLIARPVAPSDDVTRCAPDDREEDYLELQEDEDVYERTDVLEPLRERHVMPGQVSMPESSLPPPIMPRKQSCPEATPLDRRPKPLPQAAAPSDSVRPKPPPVATRKK